jgi:hypothetical protein
MQEVSKKNKTANTKKVKNYAKISKRSSVKTA